MASSWGRRIKLSIFGGSHTAGIGAVLEGLPAGMKVDWDALLLQMARRAPGTGPESTARREADVPRFLSGVSADHTLTGDPVAILIENANQQSGDYEMLKIRPRPGHADYPAYVKYHGQNDIRGGGHFSGRLTAPMVAAGALCRQFLLARGVTIGAHAAQIGSVQDDPFLGAAVDAAELFQLGNRAFPVRNAERKTEMLAEIARAKADGDSVGGIVACAVTGLPVGVGDPMFDGVEGCIASLIFGIPAVKGISFGDGFEAASYRGSENNDPYAGKGGKVWMTTNHAGGILGGLSTGMPVTFQVAFKPTPSIGKPQNTVNLKTMASERLQIQGRHDPCIVPRAIPVVEAAAAIALTELWLWDGLK